MCVRLHNDSPLNCRGASPFCLDTKRTKKIKSAEMLLCAAGLCTQTGENLGLQLFRRATLSLPYPACENLLCPGPPHSLAGFPRFFPKLFCGRSTANIFKKKYSWDSKQHQFLIFRTPVVLSPTKPALPTFE